MKRKKNVNVHFLAVTGLIIVLGLCNVAPVTAQLGRRVTIDLADRYRAMPHPPTGNERIIDRVSDIRVWQSSCHIGQHNETPRRMGTPYQSRNAERHRDEVLMDRLLDEARRRYPGVEITIRNVMFTGVISQNHRIEQFIENTSSGSRTVREARWTCSNVWSADVVTTEPMPAPITLSIDINIVGRTRNDLYRRADNWLDDRLFNDQLQRAGVRIQRRDFDVGRIRGEYIFFTGQNFRITSIFTIDVHDERAVVSFQNPTLLRPGSNREEPIFLQSTANSVRTELEVFTEGVRNHMSTR